MFELARGQMDYSIQDLTRIEVSIELVTIYISVCWLKLNLYDVFSEHLNKLPKTYFSDSLHSVNK